jgi:hypothetical protein
MKAKACEPDSGPKEAGNKAKKNVGPLSGRIMGMPLYTYLDKKDLAKQEGV